MRGRDSTAVAQAERVVRDYIGQEVAIPTWVFAGVIGLGLGVAFGPTILVSTRTGAEKLAHLAEERLRR